MHVESNRNGQARRGNEPFAMLRDELDGVLRLLGFIEEPASDENRGQTRQVLQ
jgi:hypothetical protein